MSRLPGLQIAALVALLTACSDDGAGPTDASQDARRDGSTTCRPADCQALPRPRLTCPAGTVADFTCARSFDQRCEWAQPRCGPGADGGADASGDTGGEAGGDDAPAVVDGDAADAT
jgi:hypothetical protein